MLPLHTFQRVIVLLPKEWGGDGARTEGLECGVVPKRLDPTRALPNCIVAQALRAMCARVGCAHDTSVFGSFILVI